MGASHNNPYTQPRYKDAFAPCTMPKVPRIKHFEKFRWKTLGLEFRVQDSKQGGSMSTVRSCPLTVTVTTISNRRWNRPLIKAR